MKKIEDKIITTNELLKVVGRFPRQKTLLMCHGVFDLVHPGHIRHLSYCKQQCDYIVVSITADQHILKSDYRPYVPSKLRALNLAAIELVDFVVIDNMPLPLNNIKKIKPDIYAKGYEYVDGKIDPRTQEEISIIKAYGGRFMYTPGDYVLSSSKIINSNKPDLKLVKLKTLMESENITFEKIYETIKKIKDINVFVVGDTIVDSYCDTSLIGNNAKTPTISVKFNNQNDYIGGAGVVSQHLKAAGANVTFCTILGNDKFGKMAQRHLNKSGIKTIVFKETGRPTTNKLVYIADNYRLLKVDNLENTPINENITQNICNEISKFKKGILIFSDFRHGIFNSNSSNKFIGAIQKKIFKVADSQIASRWGNILDFKGFDLITPNEKEARFALADQDTAIRPLASKLYNLSKSKHLFLTLGSRGLLTIRKSKNHNDPRAFFSIDSFAENVLDPVGCGDALLSYSSLALYVSKNDVIASIIGTIAASLEASINANEPIKSLSVLKKINLIEERLKYI